LLFFAGLKTRSSRFLLESRGREKQKIIRVGPCNAILITSVIGDCFIVQPQAKPRGHPLLRVRKDDAHPTLVFVLGSVYTYDMRVDKSLQPKLTKKQAEVLDFVKEFLSTHSYSPTFREIAEGLGLSSPATAFEHIQSLSAKGFLHTDDGEARSMELTPKVGWFSKAFELPLIGIIAAGKPIEAIEQNERIAVPMELLPSLNCFVLQVRGESMIEDGIHDGDYVVCERNFYPKNGDTVVALLENEYATLKRYYREATRIRLQPANKTMKPIFAKNPVIQGIVKAVLRKY